METCDTCKHWHRSTNDFEGKPPDLWGACKCPAIANGDPPRRRDGASFWVGDRPGEAHLLTGEAFGCVHHEVR